MPNTLDHGGYSQDAPEGIHQHKYAGGGHPGCGGYIEALEIESVHGPIFVVQEMYSDTHGVRWRWRVYADGQAMLGWWERNWGSRDRIGFTDWRQSPFWEAVDYQAASVQPTDGQGENE